MAYYILVSFILFIIINYNFIYSIIDSNFLYNTTGSKLTLETNINNLRKSIHLDKISLYIIFIIFLITFLINYTISTIAFNTNPLLLNIGIKEINLQELINKKFIFIYHITCGMAIIFLAYFNLEKIKHYILIKFKKNIVMPKENKENNSTYILAKGINDECFEITEDSLYQNVLITGSIGSGKTSGAISRLTYNLIKSGQSGLI